MGVDIEVAIDKLAGFATADQVAAFLVDQGVKGYRAGAVTCPLARWLESVTGLHVAVFEAEIKAREPFDYVVDEGPGDECWPEQWHFKTTAAVRAFVVLFDTAEGDAYEELVDVEGSELDRHRCKHGNGW